MVRVNERIVLDETEFDVRFVRSSGPGGQNVNKVATTVQLRFDVAASRSLPEDVRVRLVKLGGSRMTVDGTLILTARRFRTQERNREDAIARLADLVRRAARSPRDRRPTMPTRTSIDRRLDSKRRQGVAKRRRSRWHEGEE